MRKKSSMLLIMLVVVFVIVGGRNISAKAAATTYWLRGNATSSKVVYLGKRLKLSGNWAKASSENDVWDCPMKSLSKRIPLDKKCKFIYVTADRSYSQKFSKYIRTNAIKKGDSIMPKASIEFKIVDGKIVRVIVG